MQKSFDLIKKVEYGELDNDVDLSPDYFTILTKDNKKELIEKEEAFYFNLMKEHHARLSINKTDTVLKLSANESTKIRIYEPKENQDKKLPCIFFYHGGGFVTCSLDTHDFVPSYLADKANCKVISVDYGLAPESRFPKGLKEAYETTKYIVDNAPQYGIDPCKVFTCGDSSGGNFAAVIAMLARDFKSFDVLGQILIYPVTDVCNVLEKQSLKHYGFLGAENGEYPFFVKYYLEYPDYEKYNPYLSPIFAQSFEGLPAALFIQAGCDAILDDGLIYAKLLHDSGVPVQVEIYEGMPHAFILRKYEKTFIALDCIVNFIKSKTQFPED